MISTAASALTASQLQAFPPFGAAFQRTVLPFVQVPIRVLYLDRSVDSGDPTAVNHHDFVPEALAGKP